MHRRAVEDSLSDVGPAIGWISQAAGQLALSADTRFGIELCLEEALANLILHGRARDGRKDIVIEFSAEPFGARVRVLDRCEPYDVAAVDLPLAVGLDAPADGGRGIRLMRSFASDVAYESNAGGNVLTLLFAGG